MGLLLDAVGAALPVRLRLPTDPSSGDGGGTWHRHQHITLRAWAPDVPPHELLALKVGSARRAAHPDSHTRGGAPVYLLAGWERTFAQRLLARECRDQAEVDNIACNAGRLALLSLLGDLTGGYTGAEYLAVGTGTPVTPAATDTQLVSELVRVGMSSATITSNTVDLEAVLGAGLGNATYTEVGLFASAPSNSATLALAASGGPVASGAINTGMLTGHAAFAYTKTPQIQLTFDYDISLT